MEPFNLNKLILWKGPDSLDELRKEHPYLFFPRDLNTEIFKEISANIVTQYWLTEHNIRHVKMLKYYFEKKKDELFEDTNEVISESTTSSRDSSDQKTQELGRLDPAEDEQKKEMFMSQWRDCNRMFDIDPSDIDPFEVQYTIDEYVFPLVEKAIKVMERENLRRAFSSLNQELLRNLKLLKNRHLRFPNHSPEREWVEVERYDGEADLIHLLRELGENSEELSTRPFRAKSHAFRILREVRNEIEHKDNMEDDADNRLTTENLLTCFDETRRLFEILEKDTVSGSKARIVWLS